MQRAFFTTFFTRDLKSEEIFREKLAIVSMPKDVQVAECKYLLELFKENSTLCLSVVCHCFCLFTWPYLLYKVDNTKFTLFPLCTCVYFFLNLYFLAGNSA